MEQEGTLCHRIKNWGRKRLAWETDNSRGRAEMGGQASAGKRRKNREGEGRLYLKQRMGLISS